MIMAQSHPPSGARTASGSHPPGLAAAISSDVVRTDISGMEPLLRSPDDHAQRAPSTWKVVYAIVERGPRKHWLRIGMAFVNRDGSLNVRLDAMPISGQLHIRDNPPRDPRDSLGESLASMPLEREAAAHKSRSRAPSSLTHDA